MEKMKDDAVAVQAMKAWEKELPSSNNCAGKRMLQWALWQQLFGRRVEKRLRERETVMEEG
eukprot:2348474-Prorocentrum_lima.AAC.1